MILNQQYSKTNSPNSNYNGILPGKLDAKQTANILGFSEHEIPVLIKNELLEPLGKPPKPNCQKYFARIQILELADNLKWLSKATNVLYQHWQTKNASRLGGEDAEQDNNALN